MREQFFQALLESICEATGLPLVIPHDECAEWTFGEKRLCIRLSAGTSEIRVEGFAPAPALPIYGSGGTSDLNMVLFLVRTVGGQLLAA